jgi:Flp pilus assembly protein TadB
VIGPVYGLVLGVAAWLLARGVAVSRAERIALRLGPRRHPSPPGGPRLRPPGWLSRRAAARTWPGHPWSYGGAWAGCAVAGGWLGAGLAGPIGAVAGAVGGPLTAEGILSRRSASERVEAQAHLRETILALASGVRAGLSVRRAVQEAARDASPPLDRALGRVVGRLSVGESLEDALDDMAARLDLADVRLVVTILVIHRRTGGNLPAMLEEVADVLGDRARSRREVRALTAQGRASGAVLAVLPVAFVALLSGTGGEALGAFYRSPLGAQLLVAGLVLESLGFLWIRRIVARAEDAP